MKFKANTAVNTTATAVFLSVVLLLAACSGDKSSAQANACNDGISQAYAELERAEMDGFGDAVDMTKAGSILSAAKIQEQFEKYPNCIDKVKRARYYIAKARSG
jgi:hypothetical protein